MENRTEFIPLRNSWLDINLRAISNNIQQYLACLQLTTKLLAIVKSNAYGHGSISVAKTAIEAGAAYLGVGNIGEAVELRQAGIDDPILIIGLTLPEYFEIAIQNHCILTVSDIISLEKIEKCALECNKIANVHLKINTGMNRIGFCDIEEWKKAIQYIMKCKAIQWDGVFTHFADADGATAEYTRRQAERFEEFLSFVSMETRKSLLIHACNSAAIVAYPEYHYDMVRLGLGMYGYPTIPLTNIIPALQWKTKINYIHDVYLGDSIGYNCTANADEPMKIAVVPVGYADGYSRQLSNRGEVIVRGERLRIVGRVCMDQIMVDITSREDICIGDTVTLLGEDGTMCIDAEEIASQSGTISHEVLTSLSARLPRYYQI